VVHRAKAAAICGLQSASAETIVVVDLAGELPAAKMLCDPPVMCEDGIGDGKRVLGVGMPIDT
jgi:hypothetical protein